MWCHGREPAISTGMKAILVLVLIAMLDCLWYLWQEFRKGFMSFHTNDRRIINCRGFVLTSSIRYENSE